MALGAVQNDGVLLRNGGFKNIVAQIGDGWAFALEHVIAHVRHGWARWNRAL
jgi:hypothetical protein